MFTEANSVEYLVRDLLKGVGWEYLPSESLSRSLSDVLVEEHLRDALIRLNPEIAEKRVFVYAKAAQNVNFD